MAIQGMQQAWIAGVMGGMAAKHYNIQAGQLLPVTTKALAHQTLDTISSNGGLDIALADGKPEPGIFTAIGRCQNQQTLIHGFAPGIIEDALEISPIQQSQLAGKPLGPGRCCDPFRALIRDCRPRFPLTQALSLLRPLARRALMILRPALVLMRARKPWVRLRRMVLGWKVRFIAFSVCCSGRIIRW